MKYKHGESNTPLYNKWWSMIKRCKPNAIGKHKINYVNKGIKVCEEWQEYLPFKEWALRNGWEKGLEIDRIDNDEGYSPNNCRFVPRILNIINRSNTIIVTYRNSTKSLVELAAEKGWTTRHRNTIRERIKNGWGVISAIETPIKTNSLLGTKRPLK